VGGMHARSYGSLGRKKRGGRRAAERFYEKLFGKIKRGVPDRDLKGKQLLSTSGRMYAEGREPSLLDGQKEECSIRLLHQWWGGRDRRLGGRCAVRPVR